MPKLRNPKPILALTLTMILLTVMVSLIPAGKYLDLESYHRQIADQLSSTLRRPVTYRSADVSIGLRPTLTFTDVTISEPDGTARFMTVERLSCQVELLPLIQKRIVLHGLIISRPDIHILRDRDGQLNISDLMKSGTGDVTLRTKNIRIEDGTLTFTDRQPPGAGMITRLNRIDFYLSNVARGAKADIKLSASQDSAVPGTLTLGGRIRIPDRTKPLSSSALDLKVTTRHFDVAPFWPYYAKLVPFNKVEGVFDIDSHFKGQWNEFKSVGKISATGVRFDYRPVFNGPLTPRMLRCKYDIDITPADVLVKAIEVDVDEVRIKGSCQVRDIPSKNPRITAQAVSSDMDFSRYHHYIPYGVIVKDPREWIEQHIQGGVFRLEDGRLDGRISQIAHMEEGTNYNVLYIRAHVDKGIVSYGPNVPTFNSVKAILELKGKDFLLRQASGNFGTSPLTLEGRITDYPLNRPSAYPFSMTISPTPQEVAWLGGKGLTSRLNYSGSSSLHLTGEGFTSGYQLAGTWNLTPVAFNYADKVAKHSGIPCTMNFSGRINAKEAQLSSFDAKLGAIRLAMTSHYPFGRGGKIGIQATIAPFNLEESSSLLPFLAKYQPRGRFQAEVRGEGTDLTAGTTRWNGTLRLHEISFQPARLVRTVAGMNGVIGFDGNRFDTRQLTARIGTTQITGKGTLYAGEAPVVSASISSPRVHLTDFGVSSKDGLPIISKLQTDISVSDELLTIRSATCTVNNSVLSLKGTLTDLDRPKGSLAISAPYLDVADLLLLAGLGTKPQGETPSTGPDRINLSIRADKGSVHDISFDRLQASILQEGRITYLQSIEADLFGGKFTMGGRIDAVGATKRYQLNTRLSRASAEKTMHALSLGRQDLTGELTFSGEFTARGNTLDDLKRSALGTAHLEIHRGTIRKFAALSKILSILNVSQLFKLKLPDMVTGGMPYNDIKGTFSIKDGVIATTDLFVASNAMNMSVVGSHDLPKNSLAVTVGVQPLQTVDKVVSTIPIVGWLLTGKEKSLITAYFDVKGNPADPLVSALPVKYMAKGVLDIFKRVFQLPGKIVTDTGEVILGN
jgi:uncharacterized protein YhdP